MLSVLLLCSVGAFSQEIRMTEDQKSNYVQDRKSSEEAEQRRRQAASNQRLQVERGQHLNAKSERLENMSFYCIIRETTSGIHENPRVEVITNSGFERSLRMLNERELKSHTGLLLMSKQQEYRSGLDALNEMGRNGWSIVNNNTVAHKELIVREYLMQYSIER